MIVSSGLRLADGRYEFGSLIAVGGMGEVWRGHDLWASRTVAIKVLRPEFTGDEASLHRLRTEAHNAAMLNHPNIARVYDYREEEGTGYLVLEFVPGQSLADVLAVQSTMPANQLIDILHQCAEGLFAAHRAGVVHRDVKPGNILLGPSGTVKLTDFGISVCLGQAALTATGKVMGTAQYLAPEQALGKPATPAGDMYALGIIAYECLAGSRPFNQGGDVDIALAQVRQPPPPLPGWVDPPLRELVERLLAKDPAERPATCGELAHTLLRLRPEVEATSADTSPVGVPTAAGMLAGEEPGGGAQLSADTAGLPAPDAAALRTDVEPLGEQAPVAAPDHAPATPLPPALASDVDAGAVAGDQPAGDGPGGAGSGGAGPGGEGSDGESPAGEASDGPRARSSSPAAMPTGAKAPSQGAASSARPGGHWTPVPARPPGRAGTRPTKPSKPIRPTGHSSPTRRPAPGTGILASRARGGSPSVRGAIPFALLLLCLVAIVAGILLSGGDRALLGAMAPVPVGSNSISVASYPTDGDGRGIIHRGTLVPRFLMFNA
ncbi:MAG: protein kinase [Bifidobacteriaceae bacterium]|nr:protein kinase [Bifidobacteriaceae bacterium]